MPSSVFIHLQNHAQRRKNENDFCICYDVSKQMLTLTRTWRHFPVLLSCISYENLHYCPQKLFSESDGLKVNHIWLSFMQFIQQKRH